LIKGEGQRGGRGIRVDEMNARVGEKKGRGAMKKGSKCGRREEKDKKTKLKNGDQTTATMMHKQPPFTLPRSSFPSPLCG